MVESPVIVGSRAGIGLGLTYVVLLKTLGRGSQAQHSFKVLIGLTIINRAQL